jgi:hypothetical protein
MRRVDSQTLDEESECRIARGVPGKKASWRRIQTAFNKNQQSGKNNAPD